MSFDNFKIKKKPRVTDSPKLPTPPLKVKIIDLDIKVLIRACNNYLKGYRTAYNNAKKKNDPFNQTIEHYDEVLKERKKLEELK